VSGHLVGAAAVQADLPPDTPRPRQGGEVAQRSPLDQELAVSKESGEGGGPQGSVPYWFLGRTSAVSATPSNQCFLTTGRTNRAA